MDIAFKEEYYTAEEYFAKTADSNERTELHNGRIVAMSSSNEIHQVIIMRVSHIVDSYIMKNKGKCRVMISPFDVVLDDSNVVIPDLFVVCDPSKMDGKRCNGAPDWVIEILSSNRGVDLYFKMNLYKESGVREYWVIDPKYRQTIVFLFEEQDIISYPFETPVPVGIFGGQLSVTVADLIV